MILFWLSVLLVLYTYAGYPLILMWLARVSSRPVKKGSYEPRVSVIVSVYNEERFIADKINNLLALDYPAEKIEILIGSDGGTDSTDEIVSGIHDPRIRFFRFVANLGKPHVLNGLIAEAHGAVLVFTDARQRFEPQAVRKLVENFSDPDVGCVSGELYFEEARGSGVAQGMDAYWKYEKFLRKKEGEIASMLGATGAIYAARADLVPTLPLNILVDDMYIPLAIVAKGYRAVFESEARAYDLASSKGTQELKRKVRTLSGNFQIFAAFPDLLKPWKSPVAWQLLSHKFLRLMVPYFLMTAFLSNLFLCAHPFYCFLLLVQAAFYSLAAFEALRVHFFPQMKPFRPAALPYMFCLLNFSAAAGLRQYLKGQPKAAWDKAYP